MQSSFGIGTREILWKFGAVTSMNQDISKRIEKNMKQDLSFAGDAGYGPRQNQREMKIISKRGVQPSHCAACNHTRAVMCSRTQAKLVAKTGKKCRRKRITSTSRVQRPA